MLLLTTDFYLLVLTTSHETGLWDEPQLFAEYQLWAHHQHGEALVSGKTTVEL